mmetsp:Transcript_97117/g.279533  ORF Transcript_97117/g.279533 Transcript_97117/m.279533 type:complete len:464 (+) Transcript_97117:53-1444(+)
MSLEVDRTSSRSHSHHSQAESFLSNNPHGNTITGNSYLQTYRADEPANKERLGTSSTSATAMSIITIMIGAGVLILPQQFNKLGLPLGSLLLVVSCWTSAYLSHTMNEAIERVEERAGKVVGTLDDLALACFGLIGKWVAQFLLRGFILGATACYVVLIGRNLEYIANPPNYRGWVLLSSGLFLLTAFLKSAKLLEKVSIIGVICSAVYAFPIVIGSVQAHFDPDIPPPSDMWRIGGWYGFTLPMEQLLPSFGLFLFGFGPIEVIATARRNMADRKRMPAAITGAHVATGAFYWLVGALGAWGFGDTVLGNVTESMRSSHGKWATGFFLAFAVALNLMVTIPISLYCFFETLEASRKLPLALDSALRVSVIAFCACIGLFLPYFMQVLQIFSSTLIVPMTVFLPLACGAKSARDSGQPYSSRRMMLDFALFIVGIGCFVVGLADAIDELIREIAKEGGPVEII